MISFIQVTEVSLLDGSKGHPQRTRESAASLADLTSKQLESIGKGLTTMLDSRNERCNESYLVFS